MNKSLLLFAPAPRSQDELFRPATWARLNDLCRVISIDADDLPEHLSSTHFYIAARPRLSVAELEQAPQLRAVIEVSGAFHDGLDYAACRARSVEVLSCIPAFRYAVGEMCLALILAAARGLVREHEAFRNNQEGWFADREASDFSLHGASVGFVGYGAIARETQRLLQAFAPQVAAYDPWLNQADVDINLMALEQLVERSRVLVISAAPSDENRQLISAELIARIPQGAIVVLISRAHVVDFSALVAAAQAQRLVLATDVYPQEPLAPEHQLRQLSNVILSPHRAAAVSGGRQAIGDMIVHDLQAILKGQPTRQLRPAPIEHVQSLVEGQRQLEA